VFRREYEIVSAVRNVSFSIESGEMVAFLGPNGAGKTTTLKLLSGLVVPTSGTATVLGHIPWLRENSYRRRFSLVTGQKEQLWWDLPAQESFRLHQEIYRIPRPTTPSVWDSSPNFWMWCGCCRDRYASYRWVSGCGWN
jgi:ABC-2 type transport system ATP-binding protein